MKNFSIVRKSSTGRYLVLQEYNDLQSALAGFFHSLEFETKTGFVVYRVNIDGDHSYFTYGNNMFTARVYIVNNGL